MALHEECIRRLEDQTHDFHRGQFLRVEQKWRAGSMLASCQITAFGRSDWCRALKRLQDDMIDLGPMRMQRPEVDGLLHGR